MHLHYKGRLTRKNRFRLVLDLPPLYYWQTLAMKVFIWIFSFASLHSSRWFSADFQLNSDCKSCIEWIVMSQKKSPRCPAQVSGNGQSQSFSPPRALLWPIKSAPTQPVFSIKVPKSSKFTKICFFGPLKTSFGFVTAGEEKGGLGGQCQSGVSIISKNWVFYKSWYPELSFL